MIERLTAWGPAAVWAAVLFLLSALPDTDVPVALPPWFDKVAHVALYTVLGALMARGRSRHIEAGGRPVGAWTLIFLGALYALSDEWHQSFVPGRTASVGDWTADVLGVMLGYGLWSRLRDEAAPREE